MFISFLNRFRLEKNTQLTQHAPFEEKPYVKNDLDVFASPVHPFKLTDCYKHFLY